jgi:hypothetical protein
VKSSQNSEYFRIFCSCDESRQQVVSSHISLFTLGHMTSETNIDQGYVVFERSAAAVCHRNAINRGACCSLTNRAAAVVQ